MRLGGIGHVLAEQLKPRIRSEVRTTILGHMQRGGTPTPYDRNLSTAFGARAASLVAHEQFGQMVAVQSGSFTEVPLHEVAGKTRTVPLSAPLIASGQAVGTSFGVDDLDARMADVESAALT